MYKLPCMYIFHSPNHKIPTKKEFNNQKLRPTWKPDEVILGPDFI